MTELNIRSFGRPDDVMTFPGARLELVRLAGHEIWRMTGEPGWRYSESMGPAEGADMCEAEHRLWMMISGRLAVQMADRTSKEFGAGDIGSAFRTRVLGGRGRALRRV